MRKLYSKEDIEVSIQKAADSITKEFSSCNEIGIVSIIRGGEKIAQKLLEILKQKLSNTKIHYGYLDITLYRDDIGSRDSLPVLKGTKIEFDITNIPIIIVDDVCFTGRTARAAIDLLFDLGRPSVIRYFSLVDRGHRELPIHPDYNYLKVDVGLFSKILVYYNELEKEDGIYIEDENKEKNI